MCKLNIPIATFVRIFVLAAFLVTAVQSEALAREKVTIVNRTGQTIIKGQFSWEGNKDWGSDQLTHYIYPGESYDLNFDDTYRYWDCKFTLQDGSIIYKWKLDVYKVGTLYLNH